MTNLWDSQIRKYSCMFFLPQRKLPYESSLFTQTVTRYYEMSNYEMYKSHETFCNM